MAVAALSLYRPLAAARARIIAFPHAGGGASAFNKLRRSLEGYGIELCALQAPGRENRISEPYHATVDAMAHEFATAIDSLPSIQTAFLGHSFGGLVAYLVARELKSKGKAPQHLIASGSTSPALRFGQWRKSESRNFRQRIAALGGIPQSIADNPALLEIFEAAIRADMNLSDAYSHQVSAALNIPITVYSGTQDAAVPPELAHAWRELTTFELQTRTFSGGHFFLYEDPDKSAAAIVEDLHWAA